ncbi:MAG: glycoside hydrolase family 31 protein [Planctomycetota bacterium]
MQYRFQRMCSVWISIPVLLVISIFWLPSVGGAEKRPRRVPITPIWALECWLWEDDHSTAAAIIELLDGYKAHDIPARTIIVDAPWATRYNDFRMDEERYPEPEKFFREMKRRGVRTILWMTPMVNSESNDAKIKNSTDWYEEAKKKGYLAGGGYQQHWWHGWGGFIDYSNPEAMKWWRGMQQQVLDWGIDGWKLDDSALYFNSLLGMFVGTKGLPPLAARKDWMTTREYMDHFYRDEYQHGLKLRGPEFITLARSFDTKAHPEGFAPLDAAPVTWVGDQQHTWLASEEGIEEALNYILEAARLGYCVIGSDVGGYHGSMPIPPRLYIRWAQFSCFCGLFLNGGHGERAMWKRTPQELEVVRKFAWLHNELVPYMYSHVVKCHHGDKPLMRPVGKSDVAGKDLGDYHYLFGDAFLVAPIHEDSLKRTVRLPEGTWRYFFDDTEIIEGPTTITREFPLDEFPVYVREGSVVPLAVSRPYTGLGDRDSEGMVTWNIYPKPGAEFTQHHPEGGDTTVRVDKESPWVIAVRGVEKPYVLRVFLKRAPQKVLLDGVPVERGSGWRYDGERRRLFIVNRAGRGGEYQIQ